MRPYQAVMLFALACSAIVLASQHQHAAQRCALVDASPAPGPVSVEQVPDEQVDD